MNTRERPSVFASIVWMCVILGAIAFFSTSKPVKFEPVPNKPGEVRVVEDSVTCQPDPNAFGGAAPLIDGRVTRAQCDSIMTMLKTNRAE